ncbi:MAG: DUF3284 domain-containing protein [Chloroflexi bacterium]|nr:MAG: DUF3284 domain-containing protein [Chloroflexota bacterium]MBL1193944.1 DUF3284 domain-containing protein [Chloroflexota bacterium]NOH11238.1 DUF3284 domain-containing protein [Chloroflexota bacterium]
MPTVTCSTTINQSADKVFAYLTDVKNHTSWQAAIESATISPDGPAALGSVYEYTTDVMGQKMKSQMEITSFEENKKWGVSTVGVPTTTTTVYDFEDEGGSTKLTITMELADGAYPAAAEAMVVAETEKNLVKQAETIKAAVE